jgi:hypothetical protein
MQWRKRGADPKDLKALHSGVPAWMERPLLAWAAVVCAEEYWDEWANRSTRPSAAIMMGYETAVQRSNSLVASYRKGGVQYLFTTMDSEEFIDFIDYLVFIASQRDNSDELLTFLEKLLSEAGSEWAVGKRDGHTSLERRVPEGVAIAATEVIESQGSAGALLGEAWHAAFGRNPDAEEAYEKAIKSVEEAGAQIVSAKNSKTTLGTMVRDMKAQGAWKLSLGSVEGDVPVRMAEALWQGQESRHGGNGYRKPTQSEAEAAVMLAVPLVQWFSSGGIARRP